MLVPPIYMLNSTTLSLFKSPPFCTLKLCHQQPSRMAGNMAWADVVESEEQAHGAPLPNLSKQMSTNNDDDFPSLAAAAKAAPQGKKPKPKATKMGLGDFLGTGGSTSATFNDPALKDKAILASLPTASRGGPKDDDSRFPGGMGGGFRDHGGRGGGEGGEQMWCTRCRMVVGGVRTLLRGLSEHSTALCCRRLPGQPRGPPASRGHGALTRGHCGRLGLHPHVPGRCQGRWCIRRLRWWRPRGLQGPGRRPSGAPRVPALGRR